MTIGTLVVLVVVACAAGLAVRRVIKDKKSGRRACGGDCSKCRGCH